MARIVSILLHLFDLDKHFLDWHFLGSALDHRSLLSCLPGKLAFNDCIEDVFRCVLKRRASYVPMMDEMFRSQNDPESGWVKSDWLCVQCIKDFLRERLFSWFVNELVKGIVPSVTDYEFRADVRLQMVINLNKTAGEFCGSTISTEFMFNYDQVWLELQDTMS